jgi:hypothetical protein
MRRYLSRILTAVATISVAANHAFATPPPTTPTPPPNRKPGAALASALEVIDLKLQMAESSYKLQSSPKTLSALVSTLEEYINTACLTALPKTLEYGGNPTDPACVARMEQLLEVNPGNPAALCVRDGIQAQSCLRAYRGQVLEKFDESSADPAGLSEPALKIGLSSSDASRIEGYRQNLQQLQGAYESAQSDEQRQKAMDDAAVVYERMLGIACRIVGLSLRERSDGQTPAEPPAVAQAREKLLKVPPSMREDYQLRLINETETKLANSRLSTQDREELTAVLAVAKDPEGRSKTTDASLLTRVRTVLPVCYDTISQAQSAIPGFPPALCHAEGWYTPQCIFSLKQWRAILIQKSQKTQKATGTAQPKPSTIISTF